LKLDPVRRKTPSVSRRRSPPLRKTTSACAKHWGSFCARGQASRPPPRNFICTPTPSNIAYTAQSSVEADRSPTAD